MKEFLKKLGSIIYCGAILVGVAAFFALVSVACIALNIISSIFVPTIVCGSLLYASSKLMSETVTKALLVGSVGLITYKGLTGVLKGISNAIDAYAEPNKNTSTRNRPDLRMSKEELNRARQRNVEPFYEYDCKSNKAPLFNINNNNGRNLEI